MVENQIVMPTEVHILMINLIQETLYNFSNLNRNQDINRIFIFSSLAGFRLNYEEQKKLLEGIIQQDPTKTIYLPAFTYNSRRKVTYSDSEVPSTQNGSLSRVAFHESIHDQRTFDEDYSYLVLGAGNRSNYIAELESTWHKKSFGRNSHHDALFREPAIFFCLGNGFRDGFTPAMHVEASLGVPYREFRDFPSQINEGERKEYYARIEENFSSFGKFGREKLVNEFRKDPSTGFRSYKLAENGEIYAFSLEEFLRVATNALLRDLNFFIA